MPIAAIERFSPAPGSRKKSHLCLGNCL